MSFFILLRFWMFSCPCGEHIYTISFINQSLNQWWLIIITIVVIIIKFSIGHNCQSSWLVKIFGELLFNVNSITTWLLYTIVALICFGELFCGFRNYIWKYVSLPWKLWPQKCKICEPSTLFSQHPEMAEYIINRNPLSCWREDAGYAFIEKMHQPSKQRCISNPESSEKTPILHNWVRKLLFCGAEVHPRKTSR